MKTITFYCSLMLSLSLLAASCSNDSLTANRTGGPKKTLPNTSSPQYSACGFINGVEVDCREGEMCATVEWLPNEGPRCYPQNICELEKRCTPPAECFILESWPAQIVCATIS